MEHAYRCTVAGTSGAEPTWPGANNATVTTGGVTFQNVSGQSAYGWTAAAGTAYSISYFQNGAVAPGDRIFLSSDHSETGSTSNGYRWAGGALGAAVQIISVNRVGSVPPVAADYLAGATLICNGTNNQFIDNNQNQYWQGVTINQGGAGTFLVIGQSAGALYFKNCAFILSTSVTNAFLGPSGIGALIIFDNTTMQFNNAAQGFVFRSGYPCDVRWINTPSAVLGTVPTNLFSGYTTLSCMMVCRGVDLSAVNTTLYAGNTQCASKLLFDSCRIVPGVTRLPSGSQQNTSDEVELVNCYDGSNILSERHTWAGDLTTSRTTTMVGGAQDDVGLFSHQMVSRTYSDPLTITLDSFWMDVENTLVGASHTATVEIVSSSSLNNTDISLQLEYLGTAGSSRASFVSSLPSALTASAAVPSSSATWNSPPSTPIYQHIQVTFTPQQAGRLRGIVRLGKPSTTVYVNPQITVT